MRPNRSKLRLDDWSTLLSHSLLYQLAQEGASSDLYVITPFVIVADGLRLTIRNSGVLRGWIDDDWRWLNERVGTVRWSAAFCAVLARHAVFDFSRR